MSIEELVQTLTPQYRLDSDRHSLEYLGGNANAVFKVETGECTFVVRVTPEQHRSDDLISAEIEFLRYLVDRGAQVVRPVETVFNNHLTSISVNGIDCIAATFALIEGNAIDPKEFSSDLIVKLGSCVGKVHALAKQYVPQRKRPGWDDPTMLNSFLSGNIEANMRDLVSTTTDTLRSIPKSQSSFGLTHGDLNFGNLRIYQGNITILDFDDCCYDWYVNDIAILLFYSICRSHSTGDLQSYSADFLRAFLVGYREHTDIDKAMMEHLDVFLKLRELKLFLELNALPVHEYLDYEIRFMKDRQSRIERGIPFLTSN